MTAHLLPTTRTASNEPVRDTQTYDLSLRIRYDEQQRGYVIAPVGHGFDRGAWWDATIPLTPARLEGHVNDVLKVWHEGVVNRLETVAGQDQKPFQRRWDLRQDADMLTRVGPQLADAGAKLWFFLFEDDKGDAALREFAVALREAMHGQLKVRIISDDFFVPWGLLYDGDRKQHDPESPEFWRGFWGVRHIIDHETMRKGPSFVLPGKERLRASLAVDTTLAIDARNIDVSSHVAFFRGLAALKVKVWENRTQLKEGLQQRPFVHAIVYFCCHGVGETENAAQSIALSDGDAITANDIRFWVGSHNSLESNPLIFINACEGGLAQTRLYPPVVEVLLGKGAAGLIGPHTKVPAVFATEYAQRFFERFLSKSAPRVGPLLRELTLEFIETYRNPLGLIYTLYRASDVYVDPTLAPAKKRRRASA